MHCWENVGKTETRMDTRNTKLVPPAIARKLDPSIPGVKAFFHDLETVSLPRFQIGFPPQRLVMTLLGEFWAGRTEALPSAALVGLLGAFDINEQAARVAVGRLAARGALILEWRGRTTWYRQSSNLLAILPQGRAITAGFGDPRTDRAGDWTVLTWTVAGGTAATAYRIRTSLRELGFAPWGVATWVSPDEPGPELSKLFDNVEGASFTVFRARDAELPGAISPRSAWDLNEIRPEYESFLELFVPALQGSVDAISPSDALVLRTRAVYRWFVIATLDPDLPSALLPPDWPRIAARQVFIDVVDQFTPPADDYVRSVIGEIDPDLAALVTTPPRYGSRSQ
jgi:phenylacetic acid degradation operon negative regulatory protein